MAGVSSAAERSGTSRRYPDRGPAVVPGRPLPPRRYGGAIPTAALLSFRLGGSDGVAVEAAKWRWALDALGFTTITVAGGGPVDVTLPGLAIGAHEPPTAAELTGALTGADLVVVENLCSLPLNEAAWAVAAATLAGRPALLHHHDLPWQRARFAGHGPPPDDDRWTHVTINELSRRELAVRGIGATTVYNSFAVPGDGHGTPGRGRRRPVAGECLRTAMGVAADDIVVLQPTRALARKNIGGGMAATARIGGTYWLLGPAEDGYGPELDRLVGSAPCPVVLGLPESDGAVGTAPDGSFGIDDAYAACDVVALPSTWEGFGNPSLESVIHRRPLLIGPYPVARELAGFGFDWFGLHDVERLRAWVDDPDPALWERNLSVARARFSLDDLPARIEAVLPPY